MIYLFTLQDFTLKCNQMYWFFRKYRVKVYNKDGKNLRFFPRYNYIVGPHVLWARMYTVPMELYVL